jgi:hypothetical protein
MDEIFMLAALAQSRKALPECLLNPPVGLLLYQLKVKTSKRGSYKISYC